MSYRDREGQYNFEETIPSNSRVKGVRHGHVNGALPEEVRKGFREEVNPDVTERMVAVTPFNASHQTSWPHLCEEDF